MRAKETELWAAADALAAWAKQVEKLQENLADLAEQLASIPCFRITKVPGATASHQPPAEDPQLPAPLGRRKVEAAAQHWAEHQAMPPWLPICTKEDADAVVRRGRKLLAQKEKEKDIPAPAPAQEAKPAPAAPPAPAPEPEPAATPAPTSNPATWPNLPKPPEEKRKRMRTGLKRISFRMRFDEIAKEHGNQVATYAVQQLCGTERTATALAAAMEGYLGIFANAEMAGAAFAKAHNKTVTTEGQAFAALARARNQVQLEDGRIALWRQHVAPGNMGDSQVAE